MGSPLFKQPSTSSQLNGVVPRPEQIAEYMCLTSEKLTGPLAEKVTTRCHDLGITSR